jgi:MFS superfamily sulfate permease-like transporter
MWRDLGRLGPGTWLRAIPLAAVAAVVIAVPADLIDNPVFGRPIPPRAIDYVILAVTAALIGLILAIRPEPSPETEGQDNRTLFGGLVSFLAVGCPVCNQVVVALVGTSGALSWWAPVQPVVGLVAVAILVWTLRLRLRTHRSIACPLPGARSVDQPAGSGPFGP